MEGAENRESSGWLAWNGQGGEGGEMKLVTFHPGKQSRGMRLCSSAMRSWRWRGVGLQRGSDVARLLVKLQGARSCASEMTVAEGL